MVTKTNQRVATFLENSPRIRLDSQEALTHIPRYSPSDLVLGKLIAEGGFSDIHELSSLPQSPENDSNMSSSSSSSRFVVKHLKPELALNPHRLRSAAKDIINELHVLSSLDHPNIVKVRGMIHTTTIDSTTTCTSNNDHATAGVLAGMLETRRADYHSFFLILDRMEHSLLHKLNQWRSRGIRQQTLDLKRLPNNNNSNTYCEETTTLFIERARVAQQLASAVAYLHQRRILHRDIKPGNVCFDGNGNLQLIDFGLAVELPADYDVANPTTKYDLGNAGTVRYQAPEIISKKPYNTKSETYSLAIVIWEIMALKRPYDNLSGDDVKESVARIGCRPTIPRSWPRALKSLLEQGWAKSTSQRPTVAEMEATLAKIADEAPWQAKVKKDKKKMSWFGRRHTT